MCVEPQTALPSTVLVGLKPPWNQPQVTLFLFRRSPTLPPWLLVRGVITALPLAQSSLVAFDGSGSPMTVPFSMLLPSEVGVTPCVLPAIRLMAPTVEGPNCVL